MKTEDIKQSRDSKHGESWESHPAFAVASIHRVHGHKVLFGSVVSHGSYVTLKIARANRVHDFGKDSYFSKENLIEVAMSEAQFAQLITTWNQGEGSPVTLDRYQGEYVARIPEEQENSESERAQNDFMLNVSEYLAAHKKLEMEAEEILNKKSIGKKDRARLKHIIRRTSRILNDSGPFAVKEFMRLAERTVSKAKTEIDAFVSSVVRKTGLEALEKTRLLGERNEQRD